MKRIAGCAALIMIAITPVKITPPKAIAVTGTASDSIWDGYPQLKRACSCESWGDPNKEPREFKHGKVILGDPNPKDVGACQINTTTWAKTAQVIGDDIYTLDGNVKMAKYIESVQGMNAWNWSKGCWK